MDQRFLKNNAISPIALSVSALLILAVLLLAVFNDKGMLQVRAQAHRLTNLEAEIEQLEAENSRLSEQIHNLRNNDPTTIERLAREELRLVKPGEVILVAPDR